MLTLIVVLIGYNVYLDRPISKVVAPGGFAVEWEKSNTHSTDTSISKEEFEQLKSGQSELRDMLSEIKNQTDDANPRTERRFSENDPEPETRRSETGQIDLSGEWQSSANSVVTIEQNGVNLTISEKVYYIGQELITAVGQGTISPARTANVHFTHVSGWPGTMQINLVDVGKNPSSLTAYVTNTMMGVTSTLILNKIR